ncbi:MAG: hypothetical protein VKL39_03325 [Leptolyngbyaceae bacterium]|nr:hypothetical protein [Leptolyngbyaceae bacterium]
MRKPSKYIAIALIAFGVSGCNFFRSLLPGGEPPLLPEVATEPVTPETLENPPEVPGQASPDATAPAEGEEGAVAEGETGPDGILPLDLIPYTDPDVRAAQVDAERADPFQLLPTAPVVSIPEEERRPSPGPGQGPGELAPIPELVPIGPPPAPPPPVPEIARAIVVTGVVQLGNVPYAIVDAPNEPHGRYVREGQLLSNGAVLVKRINMNPGGDPVVIFEQFGIEVATAVGAGGPPQEDTTAAAIAAASIRP